MTTQFFQCFSVFFLFNFIFSASFLLESFRMTLPYFPFFLDDHTIQYFLYQLWHLFHGILPGSYIQERYHLLIQECLKFSDIPSFNIVHWPNTFFQ